ncbi:MAG: hypothetical protein AAF471_06995, partial [Myxococcota bacterium]
KGRRTPGVDGQRWSTPEAKVKAAARLAEKGHRAKPLKRVYIPKSDGKGRRPLGIPCMLDRAGQTLYALTLDPAPETRAGRKPRKNGTRCRWIFPSDFPESQTNPEPTFNASALHMHTYCLHAAL